MQNGASGMEKQLQDYDELVMQLNKEFDLIRAESEAASEQARVAEEELAYERARYEDQSERLSRVMDENDAFREEAVIAMDVRKKSYEAQMEAQTATDGDWYAMDSR